MGLFIKRFASLNSTEDSLYKLTDEDIDALHGVLLSMYKDVREVCKKHGLHLIAAGGTALGAVRHKGFIPWDDDMDIFMLRAEYEKLKKIFKEELGEDYFLLAPGSEDGVNCFLPRIMKKNTTHLSMIDETAPYPHGVYIDINIIEYAPENDLLFKVKGFFADALRFASYSVYWYQYRSPRLESFMMNSEGKNYYRLRMLTGRMFSFLSAERWFEIFDRFVRGRKSSRFTVPSGKKRYIGEKIEVDRAEPFVLARFEDTVIYIPGDADWYLRNLYGEYMTIPDEEDRERHMCVELKL